MIAGYLRVSTCKQHLTNQKDEIQRYAAARNFCVDTWVTEIVNGVILGWAGTDEAEEAKKSPLRELLAGSMGRRLPTLPPGLGQYHRHKRV